MSIAQSEPRETASTSDDANPAAETASKRPTKRRRRKSTSHLKLVPETLAMRERIKVEAERFAENLDRSRPFDGGQLEVWGRELLELCLGARALRRVSDLLGGVQV